MKTSKAELKRWFERNKEKDMLFKFKNVESYVDDSTNKLIATFDKIGEVQERKIKQITPTYIRFHGSNLEISNKDLQVDSIDENKVVISYPEYSLNYGEAEHEGIEYKSITKKVKKYIEYILKG